MIQIEGLHKSYGEQSVFDGASLTLAKGEKVGLVGRNGSGKSTLMRIIVGQEKQDAGNVSMPSGYIMGYLRQDIRFSRPDVLGEAMSTLKAHEDGVAESYRAKVVLSGLGFDPDDLNRDPRELSGGFQVRLNLARTLVSEPDILLLDEPTNYLDIISIRWLTGFLRDWRKELVIITHDRGFMDSVTTHTAGIVRKKLRKVPGSTADFYEQVGLDEQHYEQRRLNIEKSRKDAERFITRFRAKATKARAVKSRIKLLDKQGSLERLKSEEDLNFRFTPVKFIGKNMLGASGLGFAFDGCGPLFEGLSFNIRKGDRIAIIGQNGRGKTTLMRVLSEELAPTYGTVSVNKKTLPACFGQTNIERLDPGLTVEQEIMGALHEPSVTRARTLAGTMMFSGERALKTTRVLSGGEKSRVMLAKVLATPSNLLLLDEPSNHLDMQSTESLINAIDEFDGAVVFITHSERILNELAGRLLRVRIWTSLSG
jgi:ATP-binding cassette subfamily F protein 3